MSAPNLNYIKELSGGDVEFEARLLSVLKKELPLEIEEFNENIQQNNLRESAQNVHKIKHKINILSMDQSFVVAEEFEKNLNSGCLDLYEEFIDILKKMTIFLNQF